MPRTKAQFQEMRDKSREKILQTALKLFSSQGVQSVSIKQIAGEAGIASGLVYNYFKSKQDLLQAIVAQSMNEIETQFFKRIKGANPPEIGQVVEAIFQVLHTQITSWRLLIRVLLQEEARAIKHQSIDKIWSLQMTSAIAHFKKRGVKQPDKMAQEVAAILHGATLAYILQENEAEFRIVQNALKEKYGI